MFLGTVTLLTVVDGVLLALAIPTLRGSVAAP
jgi:hypothetical protein